MWSPAAGQIRAESETSSETPSASLQLSESTAAQVTTASTFCLSEALLLPAHSQCRSRPCLKDKAQTCGRRWARFCASVRGLFSCWGPPGWCWHTPRPASDSLNETDHKTGLSNSTNTHMRNTSAEQQCKRITHQIKLLRHSTSDQTVIQFPFSTEANVWNLKEKNKQHKSLNKQLYYNGKQDLPFSK